jgi:heme-degrading monooxygenase HmoA
LIGSFHIVEYRKPVFSPPKRLERQQDGLHFWRPLNVGGDFAWFREHPGRRSLYPRLRPDFHRWAFYAVWEEEAALDEFLAASATSRAWRDTTREACHFWLRPNEARGAWRGTQLLQGSEHPAPADGPVAHIVRLDLSLRGAVAMWGSAAPNLLHHLPGSDELVLGIPLVDRPYTQPVSFSIWRTSEDAARFAFRDGGHRDAVERVRRSQHNLLDRYATASFEPYRCEGAWKGRNVLDLARRVTTAACA